MSVLSFGRKGEAIRLPCPPSWRAALLDPAPYRFTGSDSRRTHRSHPEVETSGPVRHSASASVCLGFNERRLSLGAHFPPGRNFSRRLSDGSLAGFGFETKSRPKSR